MRKKIVLRLSVLIVFLTVLWSCHNEDFAKGETEPQRNNANFFKHTQKGGINAKSGVDYISILEAYNREKDFLTTIPDQQGMPIWDKMQIVDTENATGLTIPLSYDGETLSSLLFVILDAQNTVKSVKDMTNMDLEKIVYNNNYAAAEREGLMNTFIMMDYHTFGNKLFGNIPEDLYEGHKIEDQNNRLLYEGSQDGDEKSIVKYNAQGKILYIATTTCTTTWHCKNDLAISSCDGCSKCKSTSCSTTYSPIYIEDDSGFPTWNGDGGGGGGTPGPGGIPPKDPCSMSLQVFYRLNPRCAGGGNIDIPIDDPCEKTKSMLQNTEVNDKIDALYAQSKLTPPNNGEKAFKSNADGTTTSSIIIGGEHSADLGDITGYAGYAGYYHNHTPKGVKMLSPPDIYKLFQFIASQPAGTPVNTSFGGMVATEVCAGGCPDGYEYINFLIRFDGTLAEALTIKNRNYTEADLKILKDNFEQFEQKIRPKSGYSSQNGNFLSFKGLEEVLFNALDDMNIDKNKIILQRINKDGKVYNVTLDTNGKPQETPCPEL